MFLIKLGLLVVTVSFFIVRGDSPLTKFSTVIRGARFVVILLGAGLSMFKVLCAEQVGVKTMYGKVDNDVLYSGLNIINPLVEVTPFYVKTQNYTMSAVHDEGRKIGDDASGYSPPID